MKCLLLFAALVVAWIRSSKATTCEEITMCTVGIEKLAGADQSNIKEACAAMRKVMACFKEGLEDCRAKNPGSEQQLVMVESQMVNMETIISQHCGDGSTPTVYKADATTPMLIIAGGSTPMVSKADAITPTPINAGGSTPMVSKAGATTLTVPKAAVMIGIEAETCENIMNCIKDLDPNEENCDDAREAVVCMKETLEDCEDKGMPVTDLMKDELKKLEEAVETCGASTMTVSIALILLSFLVNYI